MKHVGLCSRSKVLSVQNRLNLSLRVDIAHEVCVKMFCKQNSILASSHYQTVCYKE